MTRVIRAVAAAVAILTSAEVRAQDPPPQPPPQPQPPAQVPAEQTSPQDTTTVPQPQDSAPAPPAPDRWAAAVDLGFNAATGNTRLLLLTTGLRIRHLETESFRLDWGVTFRYGESRGAVVARSAQTSLNFDLAPKSMWTPFVFATFEHDPFRRLDLRSNTGSGVTHSLYREEDGEVTVSAAALYSHEGFTVSTQPTRNDARWSMQAKINRRIGPSVKIENASFYKPVWDRGGDYNMQSVTKLSSKITERLAMTLSHEYLKDSTPPEGVRREDQRVQAGLTFEF